MLVWWTLSTVLLFRVANIHGQRNLHVLNAVFNEYSPLEEENHELPGGRHDSTTLQCSQKQTTGDFQLSSFARNQEDCQKTSDYPVETSGSQQRSSTSGKLVSYKFVCKVCGWAFSRPGHLLNHQQIHSNTEKSCEFCGLKFAERREYMKHRKYCHLNHIGPANKHQCRICEKTFQFPSKLDQHMNVHSQNKGYGCPHCTLRFRSEAIMKKHQATHNSDAVLDSDPKHTCHVCHVHFAQRHGLKNHLLTHSDIRKCPCRFCEKVFKYADSLRRHVLDKHATMTTNEEPTVKQT